MNFKDWWEFNVAGYELARERAISKKLAYEDALPVRKT